MLFLWSKLVNSVSLRGARNIVITIYSIILAFSSNAFFPFKLVLTG